MNIKITFFIMIRNGGWLSISYEGVSKLFFFSHPHLFLKNEEIRIYEKN